MNKFLRLMVTMTLLFLLCAGCGRKPEDSQETASREKEEMAFDENLIVVGVSQVGAESDWRNAHTESIKAALTPEAGFYLVFEDAQQKQENQIKAVRSFILQEVDYIVLAPILESGWDAVLQEAKDAGIPVILLDRKVQVEDEDLYTCWIGADFEKEGEEAGRWLERYLRSQGRDEEEVNIVTLQGTVGASAQIGRTNGFASILAGNENWNMLEMVDADYTQAKGREAMEEMLKKYDDIDVLVSENDNMTFGAIDAMKAAGRTFGPGGDITVISFDAVSAAFDAMMAGEINADFECNPLHGPRLAEIIKELEAGNTVDRVQYMKEEYFDTSMDLARIQKTRAY